MPIKEMRHYAKLRAMGNPTLHERMEMLIMHRKEAPRTGLIKHKQTVLTPTPESVTITL